MENKKIQLLIQSSHLKIPNFTQTLTLTPNLTWSDLKSTLPFSIPSPNLLLFSLNGKILHNSSTIASSIATNFSTVTLHLKHLGGGGDGGSTCAESRDCYLNMYAEKKPDKVDPNEKRLSKWTTCALSFEPLKPPCVIDRLGNVFNKEALVKGLISKNLPKPFSLYIKGLKDLIPIQLSSRVGDGGLGFECPISGFEFNGKYKFFALTKCGHVLSAKALKEVKSSACLVCHMEFDEGDKIPINGSDDEVEVLRERLVKEKEMEREKKGAGKVKKSKSKQGNEVGDVGSGLGSDARVLSGKKHGIDDADGNIKAGVNVKVPIAAAAGSNLKNGPAKRFKAVDIAPPNANKEVYASIFTSSKKSNFKETYSCRSLPLGRN